MADNTAMFEIKQYMVIWRQEERRQFGEDEVIVRGLVRCSGDEYTLDVLFVAPGSPMPQPMFEPEKKRGTMFMPVADIAAFIDVLRNEKPIFGHLRGDRPEWTSVTTTQEPVGEGELN